ncbi:unnamed protein product [Vitrella brassicaformis CCMP3155]|uniref:RING-type domain-containing protein n=2 Tax=Vitrella brassicaformis TaxID=1169539 RepID=A0A0G4GFR4_VITBC|nr:unnamed protein product [Vitrella brassicaformis CCMP3155]|eukprot:CEM28350.1 unnamed protein product [Vitrella brassicaformis CCMP3155]
MMVRGLWRAPLPSLVAVLCLIASSSLAQTGSDGGEGSDDSWCFQRGIGFVGGDRREQRLPSALACQRACQEHPACEFFSFRGVTKTCDLKIYSGQASQVRPRMNEDAGVISGPRYCPAGWGECPVIEGDYSYKCLLDLCQLHEPNSGRMPIRGFYRNVTSTAAALRGAPSPPSVRNSVLVCPCRDWVDQPGSGDEAIDAIRDPKVTMCDLSLCGFDKPGANNTTCGLKLVSGSLKCADGTTCDNTLEAIRARSDYLSSSDLEGRGFSSPWGLDRDGNRDADDDGDTGDRDDNRDGSKEEVPSMLVPSWSIGFMAATATICCCAGLWIAGKQRPPLDLETGMNGMNAQPGPRQHSRSRRERRRQSLSDIPPAYDVMKTNGQPGRSDSSAAPPMLLRQLNSHFFKVFKIPSSRSQRSRRGSARDGVSPSPSFIASTPPDPSFSINDTPRQHSGMSSDATLSAAPVVIGNKGGSPAAPVAASSSGDGQAASASNGTSARAGQSISDEGPTSPDTCARVIGKEGGGGEDEVERYKHDDTMGDLDTGAQCTICFDAPRETLLLPCGHGGLCEECAVELIELPLKSKHMRKHKVKPECPLCRKPIERVMKIIRHSAHEKWVEATPIAVVKVRPESDAPASASASASQGTTRATSRQPTRGAHTGTVLPEFAPGLMEPRVPPSRVW